MLERPLAEDLVLLGRLGKTFQLSGGLRFRPLGEAEARAIYRLEAVFIPSLGERTLKEIRQLGTEAVLYIAGVTSLEVAKALVGEEIYASKEALPELDEGLFYVDALVGLPVYLDGKPFGEVQKVTSAGMQQLLHIIQDEREHLVPLGADYVRLDDDAIKITSPPEGLFE